jgi:hypothetical protein
MKNLLKISRPDRRAVREDGVITMRSAHYRKVRNFKDVLVRHNNLYNALSYMIGLGDSLVGIHTESESHASGGVQLMTRSDDFGFSWRWTVFYDVSATPQFDFSLIEDLMDDGDVVFLKGARITKTAGVCSAVWQTSQTRNVSEGYTNLIRRSQDTELLWTIAGGISAFGAGSEFNTAIVTDPEGGSTANFIQLTNNANADTIQQTLTGTTPNQVMVVARWYKYDDRGDPLSPTEQRPRFIRLFLFDNEDTNNTVYGYFDIRDGLPRTVGHTGSGSKEWNGVIAGSNGWFLCILGGQPSTSGTNTRFTERPVEDGTDSNSFTGDGTHGYFHWRAQLEVGTILHQPLLLTAGTTLSSTFTATWSYALRGKPIEFGGALYRSASTTTPDDWQNALFKSLDAGATWTFFSVISALGGADLSETDVVIAANGDWISMSRRSDNRDHNLYENRSTNAGVTWGTAAEAPIPVLGDQPWMIRLANDDILLLFGDRSGSSGRGNSGAFNYAVPPSPQVNQTGVHAFISPDDGVTWNDCGNVALTFSTDGGQPQPVELDDGTIVAQCYWRSARSQDGTTSTPDIEPGIHCVRFTPVPL